MEIITAMTLERVIGKGDKLPWRDSDEFKHFVELTTPHAVLMGSKTYDSIPPKYRPLKDRQNLVLTRGNYKPQEEGVKTYASFDEAVGAVEKGKKLFVGGGIEIYKMALQRPDLKGMWVSYMKEKFEGDKFFPILKLEDWKEVKEDEVDCSTFTRVHYVRR